MKLAIADPPYLGRGAMLYGENARTLPSWGRKNGWVYANRQAGDQHPDAHVWDTPEQHRLLVEELVREFDGWAIAMNPENLFQYLTWVNPTDTRICSWVKTDVFPTGRIVRSWEPVLVHVPAGRRGRGAVQLRDSLVAAKQFRGGGGVNQFVGQKPPLWTRWVLDMLGYNPDEDTVDDLFGGSGAVTAEINQGVIL